MTSAIHSVPFIDEYTDYILARIDALAVPPPQYSEAHLGREMRSSLGTCQNIVARGAHDAEGCECYNVAALSDKETSLSFCVDCFKYINGED